MGNKKQPPLRHLETAALPTELYPYVYLIRRRSATLTTRLKHARMPLSFVRELVYHRMGKCQDKNEKSVDYPGQILQVFGEKRDFSKQIALFVPFQEHFFLFSR